eukprot:GHVU01189433.1.p1 GENE.GHVU01189433.1~~GHVU01189433.1.p1  ORF type:complete len:277 (+),score=21.90 GHVU01189433.1:70-900(+)
MEMLHLLLGLCLIAVAYGQGPEGCPMIECTRGSGFSPGHGGPVDYNACVLDAETKSSCIAKAQKDPNVCQQCDQWTYTYYTSKAYKSIKLRECAVNQCQVMQLSMCAMMNKGQNIFLFRDTSSVDAMISCLDNWNPPIPASECINKILGTNLPASFDVIATEKNILQDIKDGCDPLVPIIACRSSLKAILQPMMTYPPKVPDVTTINAGMEEMYQCVSKKIKQYPCKALENALPVLKEAVKAAVNEMLSNAASVTDSSAYQAQCGGNFEKFLNFFK